MSIGVRSWGGRREGKYEVEGRKEDGDARNEEDGVKKEEESGKEEDDDREEEEEGRMKEVQKRTEVDDAEEEWGNEDRDRTK